MDFREYPLNLKLSPKDSRDYKIAKVLAPIKLPDEFTLDYNPFVRNQGQISRCFSTSMGEHADYWNGVTTSSEMFSEDYNYFRREPTDYQEPGLMAREAMAGYKHHGICKRRDCYINMEVPAGYTVFATKQAVLDALAALYQIDAYYAVESDDEIKQTLFQLRLPVFSVWAIHNSFYSIKRDGLYDGAPSGAYDPIAGYHGMLMWGYRKDFRWKVLNHWGETFGDRGWLYPDMRFPQEELWVGIPKNWRYGVLLNGAVIMNSANDIGSAQLIEGKYGFFERNEENLLTDAAIAELYNFKTIIKVGGSLSKYPTDLQTRMILLSGSDRYGTHHKVDEFLTSNLTL